MARKRVDKKKNSMGGCLWVGIVALVLSAALAWVATPPQDVVPRTSAIDPSTTEYALPRPPNKPYAYCVVVGLWRAHSHVVRT
jgi:hypothetical protein